MTIDAASMMAPSASTSPPRGLEAGYGLSFTDLGRFEQAMSAAQARLDAQPVQAPSAALQAVARPLEYVNGEAVALADHAKAVMAGGADMTPGEMVMLSMRCQEFMFHCQLTSNMANRASDGLQQLFRQQS